MAGKFFVSRKRRQKRVKKNELLLFLRNSIMAPLNYLELREQNTQAWGLPPAIEYCAQL